jgi:hypothetical protein
MLPHERSLVKRLADRPFTLIGVNSDKSAAELKDVMAKESITWRSFFDGPGTQGPIATAWNVSGWPTIYVLDQRGVIRFKGVRGKAMDRAVDQLLAELDETRKGKPEETPAHQKQ